MRNTFPSVFDRRYGRMTVKNGNVTIQRDVDSDAYSGYRYTIKVDDIAQYTTVSVGQVAEFIHTYYPREKEPGTILVLWEVID